MHIELSAHEARIIGCLLEKQIATPEHYPLSLNALANACNQKSNRDPVLSLTESAVQELVDGLIRKYQVSEQSGYGSRVPKYQHRFCNTEYGSLKFSAHEVAILCELFLRGAQTPGELRSRASRLAAFNDADEVEAVLVSLSRREDGPFVVRLPREPGRRESRFAHLFSGEVEGASATDPAEHTDDATAPARVTLQALEQRVTELEATVAELRAQLAALI
jgi:uncharacterized protein YceH (UPF0502 family)